MFINNSNQTYKYPSFGHRLPDKTFAEIEHISGLSCAICGKKMYQRKELMQVIDSFSPALSKALKDERIIPYNNTNAFAFLKSIACKHPKTPIRNALSDSDFAVEFQFLPAHTQKVFDEILSKFKNERIPAVSALNKIQKFKPVFDSDNNKLVDTLTRYAEKYPDKTFSEIFSMPEVYKFHSQNLFNHKSNISSKVETIMKKINNLAVQLPEHEQDEISIIEKEVVMPIINKVYFSPFMKSEDGEILMDIYTGKPIHEKNFYIKALTKKVLILSQYEDLLKHSSNPKIMEKILNAAKELPFETNYADFFIVDCKKSGDTDREIIWKILEEVSNSFEHIVPKSKNGANLQSNGLRVHKSCNNERDIIPYDLFAKYKPEIVKNIQKQINIISSFILHGKLTDNDTYPLKIKKTIEKASKNKITIPLDNFVENFKIMAANKRAEINSSIDIVDNWRRLNAKIDNEIALLQNQIKQLQERQNKNNDNIKSAQRVVEQAFVDANFEEKRLEKVLKIYQKLNNN